MEFARIIEKRVRAGRRILFSKDDACIQELQSLINTCSRKAVISWALDLAEESVLLLEEKYSSDHRAREALELTRLWARGEIKMPVAKHAILACHAAAKEISSPEDIAHYHAIGQACGTVHANGHAVGYPIYDLTALLRKNGAENCEKIIDQRCNFYIEKLMHWERVCAASQDSWADFIRNEKVH